MKNNNLGFSLIETSIAVVVAAVLAAIAVPQYKTHVAKTQLSESISLMDSAKPATAAAVVKKGLCTADGKNLTVTGKYGVLVVSGTVNQTAVKNSKVRMASGCLFTYTVNASGVSKVIAGKKVAADLFNNGNLSKNAATTADVKLVPKSLTLIASDAAGSKVTPTIPGGPSITNPGDNVGPATPVTPTTPTPPSGEVVPPPVDPIVEATDAFKKIKNFSAGLTFSEGLSWDTTWMLSFAFDASASAEQKKLANWTVEIPPTTNLYGNTISGRYVPSVWGNGVRFSGSVYPVSISDSSFYYVPLILKYKGIQVGSASPSAENIGVGTWG